MCFMSLNYYGTSEAGWDNRIGESISTQYQGFCSILTNYHMGPKWTTSDARSKQERNAQNLSKISKCRRALDQHETTMKKHELSFDYTPRLSVDSILTLMTAWRIRGKIIRRRSKVKCPDLSNMTYLSGLNKSLHSVLMLMVNHTVILKFQFLKFS